MQQVADLKLTPTLGCETVAPMGGVLVPLQFLILFLIGLSNQHLTRFQRPYSFEAKSEPTIEIVDVSIVLETDAKPALRNQSGRAVVPVDNTIGNGLQVSKSVSNVHRACASRRYADTLDARPRIACGDSRGTRTA